MDEEVNNPNNIINDPQASAETLNSKLLHRPTNDLESIEYDVKFLGRYRLMVKNLEASVTKEEFEELFRKYGETKDVSIDVNQNIGYVKMDYYHNAANARRHLNNANVKGKKITVEYSPQGSILVHNISDTVTNEFLHSVFSIFGNIEHCCIVTDANGTSIGKGIIDFASRSSALAAINHCSRNKLYLTTSPVFVTVEEYIPQFDLDGISEANIVGTLDFLEDRMLGPRFASPGSFLYKLGSAMLHRM